MKKTIQIIGLQRSGTNWLGCLIANNFEVNVVSSGKHNFPDEHDRLDGVWVIGILKRLDHWLNSIARFPATLEKMHPKLYPDGILDMYAAANLHREFYEAWDDYPLISYGGLLETPINGLTYIKNRLNLTILGHRQREFCLNGPQWDKMTPGKRDYYLGRGYFAPARPF